MTNGDAEFFTTFYPCYTMKFSQNCLTILVISLYQKALSRIQKTSEGELFILNSIDNSPWNILWNFLLYFKVTFRSKSKSRRHLSNISTGMNGLEKVVTMEDSGKSIVRCAIWMMVFSQRQTTWESCPLYELIKHVARIWQHQVMCLRFYLEGRLCGSNLSRKKPKMQ